MYVLERSQTLPVSLETLWEFIQNPKNLDMITPPELKFNIVSEVPLSMFNGLIIEYQIKVPLLGQQSWVTEIKHIIKKQSFVDEQRLGPYQFWYHYHEIKRSGENTEMKDRVHYRLPFGVLGRVLHTMVIKKSLQHIFDFRKERLEELFSKK